MKIAATLAAVFTVLVAGMNGSKSSGEEEYLRQFQYSGTLFAYLKNKGIDSSLVRIDELIDAQLKNDVTPIRAIVKVAEELGVKLETTDYDPEESQRIETPSLVIHSLVENDQKVFSISFAKCYVDDGLLVYELKADREWYVVPHAHVPEFVEATISEKPVSNTFRYLLVFFLVLFGAVLVLRRHLAMVLTRTFANLRSQAMIFTCLLLIIGCQYQAETDQNRSLLVLDNSIKKLGAIGDLEKQQFELRGELIETGRIVKISTTCGCLRVTSDQLDKSLAEGDKFILNCVLQPKGQAGFRSRKIQVEAINEKGVQESSVIEVVYTVQASPVVRPNPLVLKRMIGSTNSSYQGTASVILRRGKEEKTNQYMAGSGGTPFRKKLESSHSKPAGGSGASIEDSYKISVSCAKNLENQNVDFEFEDKVVKVPVLFQDVHPIEVKESRFFLGVTDSNKAELAVDLRNKSENDVSIKSIEHNGFVTSNHENILIPANHNQLIKLELNLSGSGRVEQELEIHYANPELPRTKIVISWVNPE